MPFARLHDTQAASAEALAADALAKRAGWTLVPEEDTAHKLAGDAVLANDAIAVVVRRSGAGAELYARSAAGWQRRSVLAPCAAPGDPAAKLVSLRIVENAPAAVTLEAAFQTKAARRAAGSFRITTGVPMVEFRPGAAAGLQVRDDIRHVVVPELFANDVVLTPDSMARPRVGIPAENMLLALLGKGDCLAVCVWRSLEQNADALAAGTGELRGIGACEIECGEGSPIWYALLEGRDIWHARAIAGQGPRGETTLDWKRPFEAKWRGSFLWDNGVVRSRDLRDRPDARAVYEEYRQRFVNDPLYGKGRVEAAPPSVFRKVSAETWGGGFIPWFAADSPDCCFQSGRAVMYLPRGPSTQPSASRPAEPSPVPRWLVIFPIDRTGQTPGEVFCPIDVMRNALGVGVCQYALDMEGLGADGQATPRQTAQWLERLLKKTRPAVDPNELALRLENVAKHVRQVDARLGEYDAALGKLEKLCLAALPGKDAEASAAARKLLPVVRDGNQADTSRGLLLLSLPAADGAGRGCVLPGGGSRAGHAATARRLAKLVPPLVGKPEAGKCLGELAEALGWIEADQDRALAQARRTLRFAKQQARMIAAGGPGPSGFAENLRELAEEALRKKPPAAETDEGDRR